MKSVASSIATPHFDHGNEPLCGLENFDLLLDSSNTEFLIQQNERILITWRDRGLLSYPTQSSQQHDTLVSISS